MLLFYAASHHERRGSEVCCGQYSFFVISLSYHDNFGSAAEAIRYAWRVSHRHSFPTALPRDGLAQLRLPCIFIAFNSRHPSQMGRRSCTQPDTEVRTP